MSRPKGSKNKKKVSSEPVKSTDNILVSLKIAGQWFRAEGPTVSDAIKNLAGFKPRFKGIGVIIVQKGEVRKEKVIRSDILSKIFGYFGPSVKEISTKQLLTSLGEL